MLNRGCHRCHLRECQSSRGSRMEHKFIIEVRLRHEPPKEGSMPQQPNAAAVNIDPNVLQSLMAQLPHALAAIQKQPKQQGKPTKE